MFLLIHTRVIGHGSLAIGHGSWFLGHGVMGTWGHGVWDRGHTKLFQTDGQTYSVTFSLLELLIAAKNQP